MSGATTVPVYTVADESRYLIVKNVPALGCVEELVKLFGSYGPIDEYRLMDEEDCEPYTDIYWIKFVKISNARFAKRKLDNFNFLGNLLQVNYAPIYESVLDTKDKLEERRNVLLSRIRSEFQGHSKKNLPQHKQNLSTSETMEQIAQVPWPNISAMESRQNLPPQTQVQYFPTASMNATVQAVRHKLVQISQIGGELSGATSSQFSSTSTAKRQLDGNAQTSLNLSEKKPRTDGRRRI